MNQSGASSLTAIKQYHHPHSFQYQPYYQQSSSHQKILNSNQYYQNSPRQPKATLNLPPFFTSKCSPQPLQKSSAPLWAKHENLQRNLFSPPIPNIISKIAQSIEQAQQEAVSPANRQITKPKISFSYKREANGPQMQKAAMPNSCGNQKKEEVVDKVVVQQFALALGKSVKKQKNLKICSSEMNYTVKPWHPTKLIKQNHSFVSKYSHQTAYPLKKFFNSSGTGYSTAPQQASKAKQSKIASTEATRSFQAEIYQTDRPTGNSPKQIAFDYLYIPPLQNQTGQLALKLSPSKLLKKTMVFSKYDFGGLMDQGISTVPRKSAPETETADSNPKWRSYVKCLFQENEDLKNSIHCGPQVRRQQQRCDILTGFGRQIAESCFPQQDHYQ